MSSSAASSAAPWQPRENVQQFFNNALLDTIVPDASNAKLPDLFGFAAQEEEESTTSLLPIKQRDLLFFDEQLPVYVILRLTNFSEHSLKNYLPKLSLTLEALVINSVAVDSSSTNQPGQAQDVIFFDQISNTDDPFVMVKTGQDGTADGPVVFAIWEVEAVLNRPRIRFSSPAVSFRASAIIVPPDAKPRRALDDEYMASFVTEPANILEPLKSIPALRDDPPYLAASRLETVLPNSFSDEEIVRLRHHDPGAIPIVAAVNARMRYSRLPNCSRRPTMIASLDFEVTPFINLTVSLSSASVSLSDGITAPLNPLPLPVLCRPRDLTTFLYRLEPSNTPEAITRSNASTTGLVSTSLVAALFVSPSCTPTITMNLTTNVDLTVPFNPGYGPPNQTMQRTQRPNNLPFVPGAAPSTIPMQLSGTSTPAGGGLTISFSSPTDPVKVGKIFIWKMLVVNNGSRPMKLAVIPLPRLQRSSSQINHWNKRHAPKSSTLSNHRSEELHRHSLLGKDGEPLEIAPAIADENIIYALQHNSSYAGGDYSTDIISLSTDLRIGPLGPGTCHETELKMLAFRKGVLKVDIVRVVDLVREAEDGVGKGVIDVRDLPDVIAVDDDDVTDQDAER